MKVLIADDSPVIRHAVAALLGNNGIDAEFESVVSGCVTSANTANGIRVSSGVLVLNNVSDFNQAAGIRTTLTENRVDSNQLRMNVWGIQLVAVAALPMGPTSLFVPTS